MSNIHDLPRELLINQQWLNVLKEKEEVVLDAVAAVDAVRVAVVAAVVAVTRARRRSGFL